MFSQTVTRALSRLGLDMRGTDPHPRPSSPAWSPGLGKAFRSVKYTILYTRHRALSPWSIAFVWKENAWISA
jgi:hypothetical protein